jgi:small redox-active disulfide protein 2
MVTIRVLGPGCARCNELEKMCFNVAAENSIDADIQKISDMKKIAELGIISTPALIINGKTYCSGKIPTKSTLLHWLKDNSE